MGKTCLICNHPERPAIDRALAGGAPATELARQYQVSLYSVRGHRANHLIFRSEKHRGDGLVMIGRDTLTITTAGGATGARKARKRRG